MLEVLGWFGAVTSGLRSVPQCVRLISRPGSAGVNAFSMLFTSLTAIGWLVWGVRLDLGPVIASSAVTTLGFGLVAAVAIRSLSTSELLFSCSWLVLLLATDQAFDPSVLGWILSIGGSVQFLPQALTAVSSIDLSGLSLLTYLLVLSNEAIWLAYGIGSGSGPLIVVYLVRLPITLVIVNKIVANRIVLRAAGEDAA